MEASTGSEIFKPGLIIARRYEVLSVLGAGAVGTVVQVIDRKLDNEVCALKVIFPQTSHDPIEFARFRNEVLVCRKLSHPNIVRLYDFGEIGKGYYYISMEHVAGGSLGQRIYSRDRQLGFHEITKVLYQICQGLSVAHRQGVVHRDLKPDNILITESDQVKVSDFGLARSLIVDQGFTNSGETVGTPYYMAPEQLRGEKPGPSMDIYSLGILAFELAVGRRPFVETNYMLLAAMHMQEPMPSLATDQTGLPQWFEQFVHKCGEKRSYDRFSSAEEAGEYLIAHMGDELDEEFRRLPMLHSFQREARPKKLGLLGRLKKAFVAALFCLASLFVFAGVVRVFPALKGVVASFVIDTDVRSKKDPGIVATLFGISLSGADFFPAIEKGRSGALKNLLSAGCDANAINRNGVSALVLAVSAKNLVATELLLQYGARHGREGANQGPLHLAARDASAKIVQALLDSGANAAEKDVNGRTPLIYAVQSKKVAVVRPFLGVKGVLDIQNAEGKTALYIAVEKDLPEIVTLLLNSGANINMPRHEGYTPLMKAARDGDREMVRLLLNRGADATLENRLGQTAKELAPGRLATLFSGLSAGREIYTLRGNKSSAASTVDATQEVQRAVENTTTVRIKRTPKPEKVWRNPRTVHVLKVVVENRGEYPAKNVVVKISIPDRPTETLALPAGEDLAARQVLTLQKEIFPPIDETKLGKLDYKVEWTNRQR